MKPEQKAFRIGVAVLIGAIVLKDLGQDPGLFPATPVVITVKPWTLTEGGVKEYGAEKSFTYEIPLS